MALSYRRDDFSPVSHLDGTVFVHEHGHSPKRRVFALPRFVNGALIHNLFDSELFAKSRDNVNAFALTLPVKP